MKKILTILLVLGAILAITGLTVALPKLGANQGFSNPGSMVLGGSATIGGNTAVGGDLAVTGSISAGGTSSAGGIFSQDISMAAGYDFRTAVGASVFDWSNGTGLFKTTTGAVTLGGGRDTVTLNGPVLGIDGAGWTMVGASVFTLGSTGMMADGGTITFLNGTSGTAGTFSGTVAAEQLTSTDDATITDDLNVLGKADISETLTAEHLASTDDGVIADDFDVIGDLTAGTIGSDAGVTAVTTVQGEQLTSTDDITATDNINAQDAIITGDVGTATVTASGQVKAEDLYSTDDARIDDNLNVMGTLAVVEGATVNALISNTSISGEDLASSDDARIADDLNVLGLLKVTETATLNAVVSNTSISGEDVVSTDDLYAADDLNVLGKAGIAETATVNALVSNTSISGEDIASTDDARIADDINVLGLAKVTETATVNALIVNTTSTFNGNPTVSTGQTLIITDADKLTIAGVIVPQEMVITWSISSTGVDGNIFVADDAWTITSIEEVHAVAGTDVGGATLWVRICDGTEAPSAGDAAQTATFNLTAAANTVQTATLSATKTLADGNRLALDYTGALTALAGGVATVHLKRV